MTFGEQFSEAVAEYLKANNLTTLGKINRKILAELLDRFKSKWDAAEKAKKPARKKPTINPNDPARQIPPTREMVEAFHKERGYTFSINAFMAHYGAVDWYVGKKRMVNWHCACDTFQGDAPRKATAKDAPRVKQEGFSSPDRWQDIARDTEGLEWAATQSWDSLLPFYQARIVKLAQHRAATETAQRIAP